MKQEDKELLLKDLKELPSGNQNVWELPDGYIFKNENGNVINTTKIVLEKKKKEYPKTLAACERILRDDLEECEMGVCSMVGYMFYELQNLQKLLICRDAYWKIAGEEMGLGKPWSPLDSGVCYGISSYAGVILHETTEKWCILAFPTKEMRDAFYENFKTEIEICKELL